MQSQKPESPLPPNPTTIHEIDKAHQTHFQLKIHQPCDTPDTFLFSEGIREGEEGHLAEKGTL